MVKDNSRLNEKIESWKLLAEQLKSEGRSIFIKDANNDYYFGNIISINEETLIVHCFAPTERIGAICSVRWVMILKLAEYEEMAK